METPKPPKTYLWPTYKPNKPGKMIIREPVRVFNIYSVEFNGDWPVGAVAVVRAYSEASAVEQFVAHVETNYSYLLAGLDIPDLKATLLSFPESSNGVHILLDGSY